jgi:predicted metal-binding protein
MPEGTLESYAAKIVELGATHAKIIEPASVVTAPWVRLKCQIGCEGYGQSYLCPPHTPTPEQMRKIIDSYSVAILLHLQWTKGLQSGHDIKNYYERTVELERELFLDGYYRALSLLAGHCILCKKCNILSSLPCNFPEKARPSMEACGIDVYQTARNNGLPIYPLRTIDETRNIYGLILVE